MSTFSMFFKQAFLLITCGYLLYIPISLNQSRHSSPTSLINKRAPGFNGCFFLLFLAPFCVTSTFFCPWKSQEMGSFFKYSLNPAYLAPLTMPQSYWDHIFSLTLMWKLTETIVSMLSAGWKIGLMHRYTVWKVEVDSIKFNTLET